MNQVQHQCCQFSPIYHKQDWFTYQTEDLTLPLTCWDKHGRSFEVKPPRFSLGESSETSSLVNAFSALIPIITLIRTVFFFFCCTLYLRSSKLFRGWNTFLPETLLSHSASWIINNRSKNLHWAFVWFCRTYRRDVNKYASNPKFEKLWVQTGQNISACVTSEVLLAVDLHGLEVLPAPGQRLQPGLQPAVCWFLVRLFEN